MTCRTRHRLIAETGGLFKIKSVVSGVTMLWFCIQIHSEKISQRQPWLIAEGGLFTVSRVAVALIAKVQLPLTGQAGWQNNMSPVRIVRMRGVMVNMT